MDIDRGIKVGIGFKVTHGTPKQLPPLHASALTMLVGEPLPQSAAARAILTGPMWIHLDRDHLLNVGFVFGVLSDLAAQLVGAPAVHAPRFAALARLDCAQALEEQEAPRIPGAHGGNLASDLVGGIFVEPIDMPPQLLLAVLALDPLARLPL